MHLVSGHRKSSGFCIIAEFRGEDDMICDICGKEFPQEEAQYCDECGKTTCRDCVGVFGYCLQCEEKYGLVDEDQTSEVNKT